MHARFLSPAVLSLLLAACAAPPQDESSHANGPVLHDGFIEGADGKLVAVKYEIRGGLAIMEGDIILGTVEDVEKASLAPKAAGWSDGSRRFRMGNLWGEGGTVRVKYAADITGPMKDAARAAFQHYHERTSFRFIEVDASYSGDHLVFTASSSAGLDCSSAIAKQGGAQGIYVGNCKEQVHSYIHEIGHALGLFHEHQRTERDNYVSVDPSVATDGNYTIQTQAQPLGDYDPNSIMHYGPGLLIPKPGVTIGGATGLTARDINGLQIMYGHEFEPPAAVAASASFRTEAFVRGTDDRVYRKRWDVSAGYMPSTTGYEDLGGQILGQPEAVSRKGATNTVDLFVRAPDRTLWTKSFNGHAWLPSQTAWTQLGTTPLASHPTAVSWGANRIDLFARADDGQLMHRFWNGSTWTDWNLLGTKITGPIAAASWGPNRVDIFALDYNHELVHRSYDGVTWGPDEKLGGVVFGRPVVTSWGANRLDVFVKGSNGGVYHKAWNGMGWTPGVKDWENLGGTIIGNPSAVSWGPDRIDIFVQGLDGAVTQKAWTSSGWSPWWNLGGTIVGSPLVDSRASNSLDVFVRASDNSLQHKRFDGAWYPYQNGYTNLGGVLEW